MKLYEIKSFTSNTIYKVVQNTDGKWFCNCPYQFNHPLEVCDHIRRARHQRLKNHGRAAMKVAREKAQRKAEREAKKNNAK